MPTQKYLVMMRSALERQEPPSPAQLQDMYAAFHAWKEKFNANIVDMGARLKPGGKIVTASGATDGPFRRDQGDRRGLHDRGRRQLRSSH